MKKFNTERVNPTLLTLEQAKNLPQWILNCGYSWWLRTPDMRPSNNGWEYVYEVFEKSTRNVLAVHCNSGVRPAFEIDNLNADLYERVKVEEIYCTVIDKNLVLADDVICNCRFDNKSNDWLSSELKKYIESDNFLSLLKKPINYYYIKKAQATLLTEEQAEKIPKEMRICYTSWWLRTPEDDNKVKIVNEKGLYEAIDCSSECGLRRAFKVKKLKAEILDRVVVGKLYCTVIDKGLVVADNVDEDGTICFDSKTNDWERSYLKRIIKDFGWNYKEFYEDD